MPEDKLIEIAENADMIIKGYAFTKKDGLIYIFNLNDKESSMIIKPDGTMVSTNMEEIEQVLVLRIWENDSQYMEA